MVHAVPVRPINLYDNLNGGEYVALSMGGWDILAHDADFDAMKASLTAQGISEYVLDIVPPKDAYLVF